MNKPDSVWNLLNDLRHPVCRDLAWAIGSPSMIQPEGVGGASSFTDIELTHMLSDSFHLLKHLENAPPPLQTSIPGKKLLLGFYFEKLIQFWLKKIMGIYPLHHNVQLSMNGHTVGEADLIFQTGGMWQHWELSVKFFLGTGDTRFASNWIGPNNRDNLQLKLEKTQRLFQLLRLQEFEAFTKLGIATLFPRFFMKGYLFHHIASATDALPEIVNPEVPRGKWLYYHEIDALSEFGDQCMVVPRLSRLSPVRTRVGNELVVPIMALIDTLKTRTHQAPIMLTTMIPDGQMNLLEQERFFVVSDSWPHTNTAIGS